MLLCKNITFALDFYIKVICKSNKNGRKNPIQRVNYCYIYGIIMRKVTFKKNGKFSSQHIHDQPILRKQGIHCVIDQDREARKANKAYW